MQLDDRSDNFSNSDDKYKFTGKERDVETGYDYFGARYYDSRIGRWLQIDPLIDKYPGISPYIYTLNNPLIFIDPNGQDVALRRDDKKKQITISANFYFSSNLTKEQIANIKNAINSWAEAFEGLSGSENINGYTIVTQFEYKEGDYLTASDDKVGNYIESSDYGGSVNHSDQGFNSWGSSTEEMAGSLHEIGHFFGLKDRYHDDYYNQPADNYRYEKDIMGYPKKNSEQKIQNLMAPAKRIINFSEIMKNRNVLINHTNRERK